MSSHLLLETRQRAEQAGLNLFGLVSAPNYDACQPCDRRVRGARSNCGTVVVLGTGGRGFWQRFVADGEPDAESQTPGAAAERFAHRQARDLGAWLAANGVANAVVESGARTSLRFPCLAEAAGLGIVSPVSGLLLHPQFGPWIAVRAALLVDGMPFGPIPDAALTRKFQPCCGCARPCVTACAPRALDGIGGRDPVRCATHRDEGNCEAGCNSLLACPLGADHRDGPGEHAHRHVPSQTDARRWGGSGVWRLVPKGWRP